MDLFLRFALLEPATRLFTQGIYSYPRYGVTLIVGEMATENGG
jgi:hypothetical protein